MNRRLWLEFEPQKRKRRTVKEERDVYLQRLYGIDSKIFNETRIKQQDVCAGCKEKCKFHADHCHKTGRFRGLLCRNCNLGLGLLKDNIETLRNLTTYLESSVKKG